LYPHCGLISQNARFGVVKIVGSVGLKAVWLKCDAICVLESKDFKKRKGPVKMN
jgi:hypothetical protein